MTTELERVRAKVLRKAMTLRDRLRWLFGNPVCRRFGHDWGRLEYWPVIGYVQTCDRCGGGHLLDPQE